MHSILPLADLIARRGSEKPASQRFLTCGCSGGAEQLEQGTFSKEVQVLGIGMVGIAMGFSGLAQSMPAIFEACEPVSVESGTSVRCTTSLNDSIVSDDEPDEKQGRDSWPTRSQGCGSECQPDQNERGAEHGQPRTGEQALPLAPTLARLFELRQAARVFRVRVHEGRGRFAHSGIDEEMCPAAQRGSRTQGAHEEFASSRDGVRQLPSLGQFGRDGGGQGAPGPVNRADLNAFGLEPGKRNTTVAADRQQIIRSSLAMPALHECRACAEVFDKTPSRRPRFPLASLHRFRSTAASP